MLPSAIVHGPKAEPAAAVIVPVDYMTDPNTGEFVEFLSFRIGVALEWYAKHVRVSLYNEEKGLREEVLLFIELQNAPRR